MPQAQADRRIWRDIHDDETVAYYPRKKSCRTVCELVGEAKKSKSPTIRFTCYYDAGLKNLSSNLICLAIGGKVPPMLMEYLIKNIKNHLPSQSLPLLLWKLCYNIFGSIKYLYKSDCMRVIRRELNSTFLWQDIGPLDAGCRPRVSVG